MFFILQGFSHWSHDRPANKSPQICTPHHSLNYMAQMLPLKRRSQSDTSAPSRHHVEICCSLTSRSTIYYIVSSIIFITSVKFLALSLVDFKVETELYCVLFFASLCLLYNHIQVTFLKKEGENYFSDYLLYKNELIVCK